MPDSVVIIGAAIITATTIESSADLGEHRTGKAAWRFKNKTRFATRKTIFNSIKNS